MASNFTNIEDDFNSDDSSIIINLSETVIQKPVKATLTNQTPFSASR